MKEIYAALIKAQGQIKVALKDSKNPHFKSTYADLGSVWDAIKDALQANSLGVVQLTKLHESGVPVLVTQIIHSSGQHIEGEYPLLCKDPNDPQRLGSSLTYARRYSLASAIGVIADQDDDGNFASGHTAMPAAKPAPAPAPAPAKAKSISEMFEAHKLKYPGALEEALGKPMDKWTDTDKSAARAAVDSLKAGKPWSQVAANLTKAAVFS